MNENKNHWIALYLSGQYPEYYKLPNRFELIMEIRKVDGTNFTDSMIGLLQNKSDLEFFNTLLTTFEEQHGKNVYGKLLGKLNIPKQILEKVQVIKEEKAEKSDNFQEIIYKEIGKSLDAELKEFFFNGLKTKNYGVYLREIGNVLSSHLYEYHNKIGLKGDNKEGKAVDAIFQNSELKMVGVNLTTEDGKSKKDGLYKLLLGTFKNYRNIFSHNKEKKMNIGLGEYLETFLFFNQMIKEVKEKFPLN